MFHLIYWAIKALSFLPFKVIYALSDILYYPLYYIIRYRRKIVRKNLVSCFPEKSEKEIISIEKKFYSHFTDLILEWCKFASMSPKEMKKRMKFTNPELVEGILASGKNVSMFTTHYANWEWSTSLKQWFKDDYTIALVYHKLANESMDKIMKKLRENNGNICVEMRKVARFLASRKDGSATYLLALVADQSPKKKQINYYLPFLNHTMPVLVGPEKLTKKYGHVPVFARIKRLKRGYYECEFSILHEDASSLPDYELTDIYFKRLEDIIRETPEDYLWSHNRFKFSK